MKAHTEVENASFKAHFQNLQGELNAREPIDRKKLGEEEEDTEDSQKETVFANPIEITSLK